jgi:hypothetical protein
MVVDGEKVFISSVYLDCLLPVQESAWLKSINRAVSDNIHYLAGMDTNSHSDVWGSPTTDQCGHGVEEILFQHNLCVLNEGSSPTFETSRAATCIDITIASPALASTMLKWKVMQEMHLSNHHLITAQIPLLPDVMPLRQGQHLKILHSTIETALDAVAPIKPYRPKKSIFSWWNAELDQARKAAHSALSKALRQPGQDALWAKYRKLRVISKKSTSKARTASWRTFTADQVSPTQAARLNQILCRKAYNKQGVLKRDDGSMTESVTESHALLMAEHFPGSLPLDIASMEPSEGPDPTDARGQHPHPVLVDPKPWINSTALHLAFKHFKPDKCPGPDGFRPIVLTHLPLEARKALHGIYHAIIELRYTSRLWQNTDVVFLPKPGKTDFTD